MMIRFKKYFVVVVLICLSPNVWGQVVTAKLYAIKDAYVQSSTATTNYGTAQELQVKLENPGKIVSRTFIKYDIAAFMTANQIPSNAVVTNATLRFRRISESGITTSNMILRKVNADWSETGINYSNQSAVTTADQITTSQTSSYYEISNPVMVTDRTFNVTSHVQGFINNPAGNNGWSLSLVDETSTTTTITARYYSKEYAGCSIGGSCIPSLSISYYIPCSITSAVVNNASLGINDGSITPVIANGSGSNTYKWYKNGGSTVIATTLNLTGQTTGWYGLEVTGALGDKFYMAFIIGNKCGNTTVSFQPGPNYIDDVLISKNSDGTFTVSENALLFSAIYRQMQGFDLSSKSLMKFRLWVPAELEVSQASFTLFGSAHSGSANASQLLKNTSDFYENANLNNSIVYPGPTTTTVGMLSIAHKTTNQDASGLDLKDLWNAWKINNILNYGFTFQSATSSGINVIQAQSYHSSDAAVFSNTPKIDFVFMSPTYSCSCTPNYAKLEKRLSGVNYPVCVDKFHFYYDEEYTGGTALRYSVYGKNNSVVISEVSLPATRKYGDNRYEISLPSSMVAGTYILEVVNDKQEKFYLRFTK